MITKEELTNKILNNEDFSKIDYSHITDMSFMFASKSDIPCLKKLDVSNVINMEGMFFLSDINQDLSTWDISNVLNLNDLFMLSQQQKKLHNWNIHKDCVLKNFSNHTSTTIDILGTNSICNILRNRGYKNDFIIKTILQNPKQDFFYASIEEELQKKNIHYNPTSRRSLLQMTIDKLN